MSRLVTDEDFAAILGHVPGMEGAKLRPGPAALASPSGRGMESAAVFVEKDAATLFLKVIHPEMRGLLDLPAGFAAARAAGEAGVAPRVLWDDPALGAILMEAAPDGYREAMLSDFLDPGFAAASIRALQGLHVRAPATGRHYRAFVELEALIATAKDLSVPLPDDLGWIMELLGAARPVLEAAAPLVLCRNESSVSNLLIGPGSAALLVDFDRAGLNDPMYDLGAMLAEMHPFEQDMIAPFTLYHGQMDAALFARARLWSAVDDMIQALQARIGGHISERRALEWLKFGEWRLMRARLVLRHPEYEQKIRIAKGEA